MDQDFRGEAPNPNELFVTILTIAGLATQLHERTAAQQNETIRVLRSLEALRDELCSRFEQQHRELQQMYAPEAVRASVNAARQSLTDFQREVTAASATLKVQTEAAARTIWLRTMGTAGVVVGVGVLVGVVVIGLSLRFLPSLDEVKQRMNILAQQPIQPIVYEGKQWVPISTVQKLCKENDQNKCAEYGQIK